MARERRGRPTLAVLSVGTAPFTLAFGKGDLAMKQGLLPLLLVLVMGCAVSVAGATEPGNPGLYTLDTDFAQGTLVNVNYTDVHDQLQLDSQPTPFDFIWVAASDAGRLSRSIR